MKMLEIIERGVIFHDHDPDSAQRVACFPTLTTLADGRVLCGLRLGSSKDSADETIRLMQSSDDGESWEMLPFAPDTSLDGVRGSLRIAHLVETSPSHLVLAASWVNRSRPELPVSNPETSGCLEMRSVTFHSSDGGQNWSEAQPIESVPFPQPEISGPLVALQEPGHLLLTMENQKHYDDPDPIDEKCYALLSFDGGHSWPEWAMIAHDHPARKYWCNRATKLPSGKLACVSWTFDAVAERDLPLHIIYGSPDARHWDAPISTGVNGQISTLFPFDEDTLLMATSHRETPAAIRLRTSRDGGRSWDGDGLLILDAEDQASRSGGDLADYYAAMTDYTFGWSPMVRLQDGSILLAYFAGDSASIGIHYVKLK